MFGRKNVARFVAEFLGTATLTGVALAVSHSQLGVSYFIGGAVAFAMAVGVLTLGTTSGAHFNPAVTFGQWSIRKIGSLDLIMYWVAQFLGAIAALKLFEYFIERAIRNSVSKEFDWRIFTAEAVGTFIFTFGVAAAINQKQEVSQRAATIGISLFVGILVASIVSSAFLNPAIAVGFKSFTKEYAIAPLVGALVGMQLYSLLFAGDKFSLSMPKASAPAKKTSAKKKSAKNK